jgi:signal transduction histidine kinase
MSADGHYATLLDSAPDALVVFDQHGAISYVNKQAERLFGICRSELQGGSLSQLLPHPVAEPPALGESYVRVVQSASGPLDMAISRASETQLIATFRGQRSAELPDPGRLKTELFANMSHELRSPLNVIIGFAKLMYRERVGSVTEAQREYLGDILDSAEQLLTLINDLVELTKAETGRLDFRPEPVDLQLLFDELRDSLSRAATAKQIGLEVSIAPECVDVELDADKLTKILHKLLLNALALSAESGQIALRAWLDEHNPEQLRIELHAQHPSARHQPDGGLGLALAKRIVEQQGGRMGSEPAAEGGSMLYLVLPRRCAP